MMMNPWRWTNARMARMSLVLAALAAVVIPAASAADSIPGLPFKIPGPGSPWAAGLRQNQITPLQLDGKQLVIRGYHRHDANTSAYSGEQVAIKQGRVSIPKKIDTVWVAMAADQTDTSVAQALGTTLCILPQSGDWNVKIASWSFNSSNILLDAFGQPLPAKGLQVTLLFGDHLIDNVRSMEQNIAAKTPSSVKERQAKANFQSVKPNNEAREVIRSSFSNNLDKATWRLTLDTIPTDAQGRPELLEVKTESFTFLGYLVSHPDYGTIFIDALPIARSIPRGQLPVVRQGTSARERALSGQIVTADGTPIPEAIIECNAVRLPGGGAIQSNGDSVVSDSQGHFTIYTPDSNPHHDHGDLVPPNAIYTLHVIPPGKSGLLPYSGEHMNAVNAPARIVLKQGDAFHTFTFETPHGRLNTPEPLTRLRLTYRIHARETTNQIPDEMIWKGGKVPFGTYEADYYNIARGEQLTFAPVIINAQSPQDIVFHVRQTQEYHGRVIDGSTGRPMAGAFLIGMTGSASGRHLTDLTTGQWDAMRALPLPIKMEDKALEPLRQIYTFSSITRTTVDGNWSMAATPGKQVHSVIAFDRNYVSFKVPVHMKKPDGQNQVMVPPIKLYPAASVTIKPVVKGARQPSVSISPRWVIDKDNPAWAAELIPWTTRRRPLEGKFEYDDWIRTNTANTIDVPAGVKLKMRLETPNNEEIGDLVIPADIFLHQGATKDLGAQEMPHNVLIAVQATDEAGKPVEGLPLRLKQEQGWGMVHNTDAHGVAFLYVPAGGETKVCTLVYDSKPSLPKEYSIPVLATGKEKEPPIFTFKLPREVIKQALESRIPISNK